MTKLQFLIGNVHLRVISRGARKGLSPCGKYKLDYLKIFDSNLLSPSKHLPAIVEPLLVKSNRCQLCLMKYRVPAEDQE